MAENPSPENAVCKFMYDDDCASIFQIPSRLVKSYGEFLPSEATLRIDQSKSWPVTIERFRGHYFFTDGWKEFAEEVDLETREYLLFRDDGFSEFRLQPDENNGYKAFTHAENSKNFQEEASGVVNRWRFFRKLKRSSAYRLRIPKSFSAALGMSPTRTMQLRDAKGRKWPVHVTDKNCGQFSLSAGWSEFLIGNKVVVGSTLTFEFVSSNMIDVRVVKRGSDATQLFDLRKEGRSTTIVPRKAIVAPPKTIDAPPKTIDAPHKPDWEEVGRRLRFLKQLKKHHAFTLMIPIYFATEMGIEKNREIKLQDAEGRKWSVDVTERGGRFSLSRGWYDFLIGTKMVVGCTVSFVSTTDGTIEVQLVKKGPDELALFKFVEKKEGRFELHEPFDKTSDITRGPEVFHPNIKVVNEDHFMKHDNGSRIGNDRAQNGEDEDGFTDGEEAYHVEKAWRFSLELKERHVYRLEIPKDFVVGTGIGTNTPIKLKDAEGREWPVRINDKNCGQFSMGAGWYDFLVANKVVVGSIMSFEFVSGSENTIEARVVKIVTNEKKLFEIVKKPSRKEVFVSPQRNDHAAYDSPYDRARNSEDDEGFTDRKESNCVGKMWRFIEELKENNVYILRIPIEFAVSTGISRKRDIKLKDLQGREWPIRVSDKNSGNFAMTAGWNNFLIGNNVVVGSIMSFEFVSGSDITIETRVIKIGPNEKELFKFDKRDSGTGGSVSPIRIDHATCETPYDDAKNNEDEDGFTNRADASCVDRSWRFIQELKMDDVYGLVIPEEFAVGTGISRKTRIKLKGVQGREWPVRVTGINGGIFAMTAGWYDFLEGNNVVVGSIMAFEFVSGSDTTIETRVVKIGPNKKELFEYVNKHRERDVFVSPMRSDHVTYGTPYDHAKHEDEDGFTDRAEASRLGRSWRFTRELKEDDVYGLVIPKEFAVDTGISDQTYITLKDVQGREWPVLVTDKNCGILAMTTGWYNFLLGNNVVVGSTMTFEYVSGSDTTIETRVVKLGANEKELFEFVKRQQGRDVFVSPTRSNHVTYGTPYDHARNNEDGFTYQAEATRVGRSWKFKLELKEDDVYGLVIPKEFTLGTGISRKTDIKLRDAEGREWPVRVTDKNCGVFAITAGWYEFLIVNNVAVGSIMTFKFVSGSDDTIEARVVKMGEKELFKFVKRGRDVCVSPMRSDHARDDSPHDLVQDSKDEGSFTDREEASRAGSIWRFTEELKENNVYKLAIPTEFSLGIGLSPNTNITLKDAEGREWPVRVTEENSGQLVMRSGWYEFLVGNKVVVGSRMSFELVSAMDNTIEALVVQAGPNRKVLFEYMKGQGEKENSVSRTSSDHATGNKSSIPNVNGESPKFGVGKKYRFNKEVKQHHAYTFDIPKYIAIKTGIARQKQMKLLDSEGRKWPVQVLARDYYRFSSGWYEFLIGNRVVIGSTLSFLVRSANTIAVQIVKEGPDKQALFNFLIRDGGKLVLPESNQTSDLATEPENSDEASDHAEVPTNSSVDVKTENKHHLSDAENALGVDKKWNFSKQLTKSHKYRMDLPKDFAMVIGEKTSGEIQLQIRRGKKWPVQVGYNKKRSFWMGGGWVDFLVGNKVQVGSTLSLEWSPTKSSIVEARITNSGNKNKELFVKRGVGRPPS